MSGEWSPNHNGQSNHGLSPVSPGGASRRAVSARSRGQILGNMMRNDLSASPRPQMVQEDFRGSSPDAQNWPDTSMPTTVGGPVLQSPTGYEVQHTRQASRSPNIAVNTSSRLDELTRENAKLREDLEHAVSDQEHTQIACDDMLTELIKCQDSLDESQAAIAAKDQELASMRDDLARVSTQLQNHIPESLRAGQSADRSEERELRDLRLKCNRLSKEVDRKDEQLRQASANGPLPNSAIHDHGTSTELRESQQATARANHLAQTYQTQADDYLRQIMEWKAAYDSLQEETNTLKRHNVELSQAARDATTTHARANDRALEQAHAELEEARRVIAFFKQNSETVAQQNKAVTAEVRGLRDSLNSMVRDLDRQKSVIEALQLQMR